MTAIAEAFAKTQIKAISYQEIAQLGVTYFRLANLEEEILRLEDGRFYRRGSLPCGKGAVVNISVFGEPKYLRKISKASFKAYATITKKVIANGSVREFHNVDLTLVHPSAKSFCKVKIVQAIGRNETGRVYLNPQGGAVICSYEYN